MSFTPVFPRRSLFLVGALALAFAIGGGIAYLLHMFNPVVGSARSLAELTGRPVLGVVGAAFPDRINAAARRDVWRFAGAVGIVTVALVGVLVLNWSGFRIHLHAATGVG